MEKYKGIDKLSLIQQIKEGYEGYTTGYTSELKAVNVIIDKAFQEIKTVYNQSGDGLDKNIQEGLFE